MCKGMIIIGNNVAKCKVERVASGLIFTDSATGSVLATFLSNEDIFERGGEEPKLAPSEEKIQDLSTYKEDVDWVPVEVLVGGGKK